MSLGPGDSSSGPGKLRLPVVGEPDARLAVRRQGSWVQLPGPLQGIEALNMLLRELQ